MSSVSESAVLMPEDHVFRQALFREVNRALRARSRRRFVVEIVESFRCALPFLSISSGINAVLLGRSDPSSSFALGIVSIGSVCGGLLCLATRDLAWQAQESAEADVEGVAAAFHRYIDRDGSALVCDEEGDPR